MGGLADLNVTRLFQTLSRGGEVQGRLANPITVRRLGEYQEHGKEQEKKEHEKKGY